LRRQYSRDSNQRENSGIYETLYEEVFATPAQIGTETRLQKINPLALAPLNQNRQGWYTKANLTFESDFQVFRKIWPLLVLIRVDPRVSAADFSLVYHSSAA
jgi:hypothetical protein